jgi:serine/threonine-protein kinase
MFAPDYDRNLLLGILALQLDFVTPTALIAAMHDWAADKRRSIGEILRSRGDLTLDGAQLLDALVREHVQAHGGDSQSSLAAAARSCPAYDALAAVEDPDVQASLARAAPSTIDPNQTVDRPAERSLGQPVLGVVDVRYRVLRLHARGGLGQVFVAEDTELHREVALKEILPQHVADPASRARFVLEAEVTGGLEHPGIVPVYGLGAYADGRPYYAMRLVRGESLTDAIRRYHTGASAGQRSLAFRQLLGRFVAVCQAVAYAHSRGVLHRDLKPGNVMLGAYGETHVVDWGLAKATAQPGDGRGQACEAALRPSSGSGSGVTLAGQAVGTPAYMSPEQATGRLDQLGPASDVYSLGATLYCLLTGKQPFDAESGDVLVRVQRGDFPPPRQVASGVAPPLEAVCIKAMALHPASRYPTALALAADVEHWLADEPVTARLDPLPTRLARWGRRHKPLVTGAAALLVTAVAALSVGLFLLEAKQRETDTARKAAIADHTLAEANFQTALEAVDQFLTRVGEVRLADVPQMEPLRRKLLEDALHFQQQLLQTRGDDAVLRAAAAYGAKLVGDANLMLGQYDEAERHYLQALEGLDVEELTAADGRFRLALTLRGMGMTLYRAGRLPESRAALTRAVGLLRKDLDTRPDGPAAAKGRRALAETLNTLAVTVNELHLHREAYDAYVEVRRLLEAPADAGSDGEFVQYMLAAVHHNLGDMLVRSANPGLPADVTPEACYRRSIEILDKLLGANPKSPRVRRDLANSLMQLTYLLARLGRPAEAEAMARRAVEMFAGLAADFPATTDYEIQLAAAHHATGYLRTQLGRQANAEAGYRASIDILDRLIARSPGVPKYQADQANSLMYLAALMGQHGRLADAEAALVRARDVLSRVHAEAPNVPDFRFRLAAAYHNLGNNLCEQRRWSDAEPMYRLALDHLDRLVAAYPSQRFYSRDRANTLGALGGTLRKLGRDADAEPSLERAVKAWRGLVAAAPDDADYRLGYALALANCGDHAAAAREADDLAGRAAGNVVKLYNMACLYARCAVAAEKDSTLDEPSRKERARDLADRAVQTLRNAMAGGFANLGTMRTDSDLDPIRERDDFKALLAELESKNRPPAKP